MFSLINENKSTSFILFSSGSKEANQDVPGRPATTSQNQPSQADRRKSRSDLTLFNQVKNIFETFHLCVNDIFMGNHCFKSWESLNGIILSKGFNFIHFKTHTPLGVCSK